MQNLWICELADNRKTSHKSETSRNKSTVVSLLNFNMDWGIKLTKDSINNLFVSAKIYLEKFVGNNYLFAFKTNGNNFDYIEVDFSRSSFKHLTGIKTEIKAVDFFEACINRKFQRL